MWLALAFIAALATAPGPAEAPSPPPGDRLSPDAATRVVAECWGSPDGQACVNARLATQESRP